MLTVILSLLLPGSAAEACPMVAGPLAAKAAKYASMTKENDDRQNAMVNEENQCTHDGDVISHKIADLAEAKSCIGEMDARHIDKEMNDLGYVCHHDFIDYNEKQKALHRKFDEEKADLLAATAIIDGSAIAQFCTSSTTLAHQLVNQYNQLEKRIIKVQDHSLDGRTHFGRFEQTAGTLRDITNHRGNNCADLAAIVDGVNVKPVPQGESVNPESTITGNTHAPTLSEAPASKDQEANNKLTSPELQKQADANASEITRTEDAKADGEKTTAGRDPASALPPGVAPAVILPDPPGATIAKASESSPTLFLAIGSTASAAEAAAAQAATLDGQAPSRAFAERTQIAPREWQQGLDRHLAETESNQIYRDLYGASGRQLEQKFAANGPPAPNADTARSRAVYGGVEGGTLFARVHRKLQEVSTR